MGDSTIQGYIQTLIQADSSFADADVTLGDFRVLDSGGPPYAVILPGAIVEARRSGDWSQVQFFWEHEVDVFERFLGDSYTSFVTARQTVVDIIARNPTLGGNAGISNTLVTRATAPLYVYPEGGGDVPTFVLSRLTVRTVEEVLYAGSGEFV